MADFTPSFPSSSSSLNPVAILTESSCSLSSSIDVLEEEDSCSICLEPFNINDPSTVTTCKHEYHLDCILEWLGKSKQCPVCWQLLIFKDPACQELLGAIEREKKSRLKKISFLAPPTVHYSHDEFQTEHLRDSFTVNSNVDEHMQHLANATSSTLYLSRRERHRSSRLHPSEVLVTTSLANVLAGVDHADTASSEERRLLNCGSYDSLASNRGRPHGFNSGPLPAIAPSSNGETGVNGGVSINPRFLYSQSPPDLQRSTSSETSPLSESIKSKFSAASARYKESFSKSTKNFKEKLLARNATVKELSKEVHREMNAGITRMIKRFDHIASKRADDGVSSSFNFKGKAVLQNVIAQTLNKHREKVVDEITSDAASHTPIASAPGGVEVSQAQSGH